ncbi:Protein srek1IP1 [Chytriomyces hyalinus]|nr:Protein srek1IP1 [Chytriomyces hyalinus]
MSCVVKVSNISNLVSESTLRDLFAHLGEIKRIEMLGTSQFNASTKEALVEFNDATAAGIAMHLTGTELGDHMLLVTSYAVPLPAVPTLASIHPSRVPALSVMAPHSLMGNALGTGVPGTNIRNPYVTPQLYQLDPARADEIGRTVYVGNISLLISELDLTQMFSACGPVTFIKMAGDPAHGCRFAFVEFAVVDAANEAVKLHGTPLAERPLKVTYSKNAINKGPKKVDDETMRRVREAEMRILSREKQRGGGGVSAVEMGIASAAVMPAKRRRSYSRSRSRSYEIEAVTDAEDDRDRVQWVSAIMIEMGDPTETQLDTLFDCLPERSKRRSRSRSRTRRDDRDRDRSIDRRRSYRDSDRDGRVGRSERDRSLDRSSRRNRRSSRSRSPSRDRKSSSRRDDSRGRRSSGGGGGSADLKGDAEEEVVEEGYAAKGGMLGEQRSRLYEANSAHPFSSCNTFQAK